MIRIVITDSTRTVQDEIRIDVTDELANHVAHVVRQALDLVSYLDHCEVCDAFAPPSQMYLDDIHGDVRCEECRPGRC